MNDNKKLMELQERFKKGDMIAYNDIWLKVYELAKKNTHILAKKRGVPRKILDVPSLAMEATVCLMERFKKIPGYEIKKSWCSAICFCVRNSMDSGGYPRKMQTAYENSIEYLRDYPEADLEIIC